MDVSDEYYLFVHASLSSTPPDSCPGFPILPAPNYDPCLVPLVPRSPVSCPGFPILPVPDDDPRFAPLVPRSPVSCPGFPILPVPDDDPRFAPLDPRSPISCPGFPILPAPNYDPRLVPLVPRSPISCPGFPILPAPTTILIKFVTNDTHLSVCCYWVLTTPVSYHLETDFFFYFPCLSFSHFLFLCIVVGASGFICWSLRGRMGELDPTSSLKSNTQNTAEACLHTPVCS